METTIYSNELAPPLVEEDADYLSVESRDAFGTRLMTPGSSMGDGVCYDGLGQVLEAVRDIIPCAFAVYRRFDTMRGQARTISGGGLPEAFPASSDLLSNICYQTLVQKGQSSARIGDLAKSPYAEADPDVGRYKLKSYLGAAVAVSGGVTGALAVFDRQPNRFVAGQTKILEAMAHAVSLIEAYDRVQTELYRKINKGRFITAVGAKAITAAPKKLLSFCLKHIGHWSQADAVALFWMGHDGNPSQSNFEYWSRLPSAGKAVVEPNALMSLDIVAEMIEKQQPVYCCDKSVLGATPVQEVFQRKEIGAVLFLPISFQKKFYGLCCLLFNARLEPWDQEDIDVLMTVMGILSQWRKARSISSELDESQALNKQMLKLSPAAIYRVDFRKNRLVQVNDYLCRYTGYSEQELLNINPEEVLTPESRQIYRQRCMDFIAGHDVPDSMEYQFQTKSGRVEWARLHIRFILEDGHLTGAIVVANKITEWKQIMQELQDYRVKLESLVKERTRELRETNQQLHVEIDKRTQTAKQLQMKSERLKELNTAMGVLLDKRNEDRLAIQENIRINLRQLVEPYIERLATSGLNPAQRQLLDVINMNISEVVDAPLADVSEKFYIFSPGELQVANLIRNGKTTKDIARLMNWSSRTVESYRNSIRKKLGLKNRRINLRTYLSSKD